MTKRLQVDLDGKFRYKGHTYKYHIAPSGTGHYQRKLVWNRTAYKTRAGLTKEDITLNKHGELVSKKKSALAISQNHLGKHLRKRKHGKTRRKH